MRFYQHPIRNHFEAASTPTAADPVQQRSRWLQGASSNRNQIEDEIHRPQSTTRPLAPGSFPEKRSNSKINIIQSHCQHFDCKNNIDQVPHVHADYRKCIREAPQVHSDYKNE